MQKLYMKKLHIAVTFFYNEKRFAFLEKTCSQFEHFAEKVNLNILTNTHDKKRIDTILSLINKNINAVVSSPTLLGHPYLLPWCHLPIFRQVFENDADNTHFMYLEDDTFLTQKNISYWLNSREILKDADFIPSFLRYENMGEGVYSTDIVQPEIFGLMPKLKISNNYCYINFSNPYQGMFLFDRELMAEHLNGPSSNPDFGKWSIREKAAQGLTFANVPKKFYSRNLVGFDLKKFSVDPDSFIHHLPNNYAENPDSIFAKIQCRDLVIRSFLKIQIKHWRLYIKQFIKKILPYGIIEFLSNRRKI